LKTPLIILHLYSTILEKIRINLIGSLREGERERGREGERGREKESLLLMIIS
jgi:hypothetical protein